MINAIFLFLLGFILVGKDKVFNEEVKEKLSPLWHILLKKFNLKDNYILLIMQKYLPESKDSMKIYEEFVENFQLDCDVNYNHTLKINRENFVLGLRDFNFNVLIARIVHVYSYVCTVNYVHVIKYAYTCVGSNIQKK